MRNIIIVDDDPVNNYVCTSMIRSVDSKTNISSFTNPVKAFSYVSEFNLDSNTTILLDLNMPEMDGWEFLERFGAIDKKCDIYIVTSSINPAEKERSQQYPVVKSFLSKPLSFNHVDNIVNHRAIC